MALLTCTMYMHTYMYMKSGTLHVPIYTRQHKVYMSEKLISSITCTSDTFNVSLHIYKLEHLYYLSV